VRHEGKMRDRPRRSKAPAPAPAAAEQADGAAEVEPEQEPAAELELAEEDAELADEEDSQSLLGAAEDSNDEDYEPEATGAVAAAAAPAPAVPDTADVHKMKVAELKAALAARGLETGPWWAQARAHGTPGRSHHSWWRRRSGAGGRGGPGGCRGERCKGSWRQGPRSRQRQRREAEAAAEATVVVMATAAVAASIRGRMSTSIRSRRARRGWARWSRLVLDSAVYLEREESALYRITCYGVGRVMCMCTRVASVATRESAYGRGLMMVAVAGGRSASTTRL